jgi:hypothetical protein
MTIALARARFAHSRRTACVPTPPPALAEPTIPPRPVCSTSRSRALRSRLASAVGCSSTTVMREVRRADSNAVGSGMTVRPLTTPNEHETGLAEPSASGSVGAEREQTTCARSSSQTACGRRAVVRDRK